MGMRELQSNQKNMGGGHVDNGGSDSELKLAKSDTDGSVVRRNTAIQRFFDDDGDEKEKKFAALRQKPSDKMAKSDMDGSVVRRNTEIQRYFDDDDDYKQKSADDKKRKSAPTLGHGKAESSSEAPPRFEDVEIALKPDDQTANAVAAARKKTSTKGDASKENEKQRGHQQLAFLPPRPIHTEAECQAFDTINSISNNNQASPKTQQSTRPTQNDKIIAERDAVSQAIANSTVPSDGQPGAYSTVPGLSPRRRTFAVTQSVINETTQMDEEAATFNTVQAANRVISPLPQSARITPSTHLAVANMVSEIREEELPVAEAMEECNKEKREKEKTSPLFTGFVFAVVLAAVIGVILIVVLVIQGKDDSEPTSSPTASPSISTESYVLSMLPNYTEAAIALDQSSAQYKAFEWLLQDPLLWNYSDSQNYQRFALATFFYATGGPTWTYAKDWLSYDVSECSWYFRQTYEPPSDETETNTTPPCDVQFEMENLWQWASKMVGTLPPELFLMTSLRSINLQKQTDLTGPVPSEIGLCTRLEQLTLSDNAFSELASELGQLTSLKDFRVANSQLFGTIPSQFGRMESLETLDLSRNILQEFPSELGQLKELSSLILSTNSIYGSIPSEFGDMSSLATMQLFENALIGPLVTELGKLKNLTSLLLFDNLLTGTIPTQLAGLSKLERLHIYGNDLTGTLPAAVCELPHLSRPKIDCLKVECPSTCDCDCRDPEPMSFGADPPETTFYNGTVGGYMDSNVTTADSAGTRPASFVGSLPPYTQASLQNPNSPQSDALKWLELHPQYELFDYWRKSQLFALATFYYSYEGDDWHDDDQEGWLSYTIEECLWSGNECSTYGEITELSLQSQSELLSGTTPPEVSMLTSLETLDVFDMHLSNNLASVLPSQLTSLANFSQAHLYSNRLTGTLPSFVGGFQQLTSLRLNTQTLTGTVPTALGLLENLRFLTLNNNFFTGELPSQLGLLSTLESLSVHATDITGTVPDEICALPALSSLQVSCLRVVCPEACTCTCDDEL